MGKILLFFMVVVGASPIGFAQETLFDPRFDEVRRASVAWDRRTGPEREILDVVCLVPDLPTFYKAISHWDQKHYFPVLLDDVETSLKFLRAFRPARIVRFPKDTESVESVAGWDLALETVGRAWSVEGTPSNELPRADAVPTTLGETPPGVVVSYPESPSLPAAVALAAGRFQPLLLWKVDRRFDEILKFEEARSFARNLESLIAKTVGKYDALGDDLDFVTLAGEYPYKYESKGERNAFDDLILRTPKEESPAGGAARGEHRWAYAGRISGDPVLSVYRAMCSLFLRPSTALLYNTYKEAEKPWSGYSMLGSVPKINAIVPANQKNGERATLAGWHQTFDPSNKFGLILLNTHGGPTEFHLESGPGQTADIPESAPTALLMIHSFSAESPQDPQTLAGRWLANGAYLFFGSLNEPFLEAFRSPKLVSSFLAENLPVVSAVRRLTTEPYGTPWRLVFFGDPLNRLKPVGVAQERSIIWGQLENWPAYVEFRQPKPEAPETERLNWVLKTAIFRQQSGVGIQQKIDLPATILAINREKLEPKLRPIHDDLLVAILVAANKPAVLLERLLRIPAEEVTSDIRRHRETVQTLLLQKDINAGDIRAAVNLWNDVARHPGSRDFVKMFTNRVGRLADTPIRLSDWKNHLIAALKTSLVHKDNQEVVNQELTRVTKLVAGSGS